MYTSMTKEEVHYRANVENADNIHALWNNTQGHKVVDNIHMGRVFGVPVSGSGGHGERIVEA